MGGGGTLRLRDRVDFFHRDRVTTSATPTEARIRETGDTRRRRGALQNRPGDEFVDVRGEHWDRTRGGKERGDVSGGSSGRSTGVTELGYSVYKMSLSRKTKIVCQRKGF